MSAYEVQLPERLDHDTLIELRDRVRAAPADAVLRVWGASEGVFCEGLALGRLVGDSRDREEGLDAFEALAWELVAGSRPSIAVVEGRTIGGGLGIACACDVVLAGPNARFGLPEPLFGLIPGFVTPLVRTRITGPALRRMAISGETIDAAEALALGLVDAVVEDGRRSSTRWVRRLGRSHPPAVGRLKGWLADMDGLKAELARGRAHLRELLDSPEARRRIKAFEQGLSPWEAP